MKCLLTILFTVITFFLSAHDIQENVLVTGIVNDKSSNPIEGVTVRALTVDSLFLSGATTNEKGHFALKVPSTQCFIEITCLGYQTCYISFSIDKSEEKYSLDTIKLQDASINLAEVTVTGRAVAMQMRGDTLEYNTDIYKLPEQASVRDLLKLLPNVTITDKGQILVQGKAVSKILVDGKEFLSNDPEMVTKSLPGKIVDKVQVVERSSEADRLTGFDNGDKETVLNLSVKEENKVGITIQAEAGGGHDINGSKARYRQDTYVNVLKKEDIFNVSLSNNNTDGGMAGMDNATSRIGLTINKKLNKRLNFSGFGMYDFTKMTGSTLTNKQTILSPESSLYDNSNSLSENRNKNLYLDTKTEWNPDEKNTLIVQVNLGHTRSKTRDNDIFSSFNEIRDTLYNGNSITDNHGKNYSLDMNINYAHRLKKEGRVLSTFFSGTINQGTSDNSYNWNRRIYDNNVFQRDSLVSQQATNENSGKQLKWGLSYVEPVAKKRFMQLAYTMFAVDRHSDKNTYDVSNATLPDKFRLLPDQSPMTQQSSFSQRFTLNYKSLGEKTDYTVGMNVDIDNSENETRLPDDSPGRNVNQKVTNYSPVLNVKHRFDKSNTLTFDYIGTMASPSTSQLQDYTDISNPTNSIKGNPNLKPQFLNVGSLYFSGSNSDSKSNYRGSLYGRYTMNAIQPALTINPETGNQTTTYKNINGNWGLNLRLYYFMPVKGTNFSIGNTLYGGYERKSGFMNQEISTMKTFDISGDAFINYRISDFDFNLRGMYACDVIRGQKVYGSNTKTHDWEVQFTGSCLLPYKIRVASSFGWKLKRGYGESGDMSENILNITLSRDCFSKKYGTGTIQISGYDLLQSRKHIFRSVESSFVQDTKASVMGSYFLCSFVYSFNFFPG